MPRGPHTAVRNERRTELYKYSRVFQASSVGRARWGRALRPPGSRQASRVRVRGVPLCVSQPPSQQGPRCHPLEGP